MTAEPRSLVRSRTVTLARPSSSQPGQAATSASSCSHPPVGSRTEHRPAAPFALTHAPTVPPWWFSTGTLAIAFVTMRVPRLRLRPRPRPWPPYHQRLPRRPPTRSPTTPRGPIESRVWAVATARPARSSVTRRSPAAGTARSGRRPVSTRLRLTPRPLPVPQPLHLHRPPCQALLLLLRPPFRS